MFGVVAIGLTLLFNLIVNTIYELKGGDTGITFWPPAHYIRGPLMMDNGYTV